MLHKLNETYPSVLTASYSLSVDIRILGVVRHILDSKFELLI